MDRRRYPPLIRNTDAASVGSWDGNGNDDDDEGHWEDVEEEEPEEEDHGRNLLKLWIQFFKQLKKKGLSYKEVDSAAVTMQEILLSAQECILDGLKLLAKKLAKNLRHLPRTKKACESFMEKIPAWFQDVPELEVPLCVRTRYRRENMDPDLLDTTEGKVITLPTDRNKYGFPCNAGRTVQYNRKISSVLYDMSRSEEVVKAWKNGSKAPCGEPLWWKTGKKVYWHPAAQERAQMLKQRLKRRQAAGEHGTAESGVQESEDFDDERVLFLDWFSDDVVPAGGKCRSTNRVVITHSYITVRNFPPHLTRTVDYYRSVHFSLSKMYGKGEENKKWGYLMNDLKNLIEDGLVLHNGERWKVILLFISGDQLEFAYRLGMNAHFGGQYFDRLSFMTKKDRLEARNYGTLRRVQLEKERTKTETEEDFRKVVEEGRASRGVERVPELRRLPMFHPYEFGSTAPCVGHDFFSGTCTYDVPLAIKELVARGLTTVEEVTEWINAFKDKLTGQERTDFIMFCDLKPGKAMKLRSSMAQNRTFCRLITLILLPLAQRKQDFHEDPTWQFMRSMTVLGAMYSSFSWTEKQVQDYNREYERYINLRYLVAQSLKKENDKAAGVDTDVQEREYESSSGTDTGEDTSEEEDNEGRNQPLPMPASAKRKKKVRYDSEITLKPKHCTLLRYGDFTTSIAPPAHYSSLTCETKNGLVSRDLKRGRSFNNPIQSLKCQVELQESWFPEVPPLVTDDRDLPGCRTDLLAPLLRDLIRPHKDNHSMVSSACYCGSLFQVGGFVAYYDEDDKSCETFQLGKILCMLTSMSKNVKFVLRKYEYQEDDVVQGWKITSQGMMEVITEQQLAAHLQYSSIDMKESGEFVTMACVPTIF